MLGRLRHDVPLVVEALAPGAPGDLVEVAHARACAVFSPSYLQSWVNSTVRIGMLTPDAQRVGAADDLEQALLRQPLDQQPVLRQQPGVVEPDAVAQKRWRSLP